MKDKLIQKRDIIRVSYYGLLMLEDNQVINPS